MTAEEVRVQLGLLPWATVRKQGVDDGRELRRSGRTTKMLCDAVAWASEGNIAFIVAHSHWYTRSLVALTKDMAERCGVATANVFGLAVTSTRRGSRESRGVKSFIDHAAFMGRP